MNGEMARAAVKTAWKLVVENLGGVEATAAACGIARSLVSEYGNRSSDRYPPAHTIIAAEALASEPMVSAALARAAGYELTLTEAAHGHSELAAIIAELSKDVGALFATAAHALTHEALSETELQDLLREFGDMHRVTSEALTLLKRKARGEHA